MKRFLNILLLILVISCFSVLSACSGSLEDDEITEEPDEMLEEKVDSDTDSDQDADPVKDGSNDPEPFPGSTFEHEVTIKVNGVIEEDKGEEWWKFD